MQTIPKSGRVPFVLAWIVGAIIGASLATAVAKHNVHAALGFLLALCFMVTTYLANDEAMALRERLDRCTPNPKP